MPPKNKVVPPSPVNVIDFSSIIDFDRPNYSGNFPNAPDLLISKVRCANSILDGEAETQTKDSITAPCSTSVDENDENSVVSSLSSHSCCAEDVGDGMDREYNPKDRRRKICRESSRDKLRRSIFSHYWRITGQEPLELIREHSNMTRTSSNPQLSALVQEETAEVHSKCQSHESPSPSTRRRSIFGGLERSDAHSSIRSLPELNSVPSHTQIESAHKTRSISSLRSSELLISCLRKSSFNSSCQKRDRLHSSTSSVSFDVNVQVITYQNPLENWSDGSWSTLFGIEK